MIKKGNVNIKKTYQGYSTSSYLNLVLNKLKIMGVLLVFIPFWRPSSKKFPCAHQLGKLLKSFQIISMNYKLTRIKL